MEKVTHLILVTDASKKGTQVIHTIDEVAKELVMAFNFLTSLKLKSNLEKLDLNQKIDNYINPNKLNTMEKDLLKDSFKIVNRLKKHLEFHFKLNYV